jgi:hypothetical protein
MQHPIEPEADRTAKSRADAIVLAVALLPIVLVGIILEAHNRCILHLGYWFAVREIVSAGRTAKATSDETIAKDRDRAASQRRRR